MQTALLGLGELLIAVTFGHLWLNETLTNIQWAGAILLAISLLMVTLEPPSTPRPKHSSGWLNWIQP
jgi:drug/metabolite transporter (DMT)-like permease